MLIQIFSLVKILVWVLLIFFFLSSKLFKKHKDLSQSENIISNIIKMCFSTIIIVQGLSLIGTLDTASIILSFTSLCLGRAWHKDPEAIKLRARKFWREIHYFIFRFLDNLIDVKSLRRNLYQKFLAYLKTLKHFILDHKTFLTLCFGIVTLYIPELLNYPFPESQREYENILLLKRLARGEILQTSFYPLGLHSIVHILKSVTLLDPIFIWKCCKLITQLLLATGMYFGSKALTKKDSHTSALISTALISLFPGTVLTQNLDYSNELHPWFFGSAIILIGSISFTSALAKNKLNIKSMSTISALLAFIHPLNWITFSFSSLFSLTTSKYALNLKTEFNYKQILAVLSGGIIFSLFAGTIILISGGNAEFLINETFSNSLNINNTNTTPILLLGPISSIAFFLLPLLKKNSIQRTMALSYSSFSLGFWALINSEPLGIEAIFSIDALKTLYLPISGMNFSLLLYHLGLKFKKFLESRGKLQDLSFQKINQLSPILVISLLFLFFRPQTIEVKKKMQPLETISVLNNLKQEFQEGSWTIVANHELHVHSLDYGKIMSKNFFINSYDSKNYKWDPNHPKRTIPSKHAFIFINKKNFKTRKQTREVAQLSLDEKLLSWCKEYQNKYKNMKKFYSSPDLEIYHIERSVEEEKAALKKYNSKKVK